MSVLREGGKGTKPRKKAWRDLGFATDSQSKKEGGWGVRYGNDGALECGKGNATGKRKEIATQNHKKEGEKNHDMDASTTRTQGMRVFLDRSNGGKKKENLGEGTDGKDQECSPG